MIKRKKNIEYINAREINKKNWKRNIKIEMESVSKTKKEKKILSI